MERDMIGELRELMQLAYRYRTHYIATHKEEEGTFQVQNRVLKYIYRHEAEDVYQKDIEKVFVINRSTASTMLKSLENKAYIKRIPNPCDMRMKRLVTTELGRNYLRDIFSNTQHFFDQLNQLLCREISEEDFAVFERVLLKMKENMQDEENL